MRELDQAEISREDGQVNMDFFKYPSTPHLAVLGHATVRDDKVLSPWEVAEFLTNDVFVEEKIDGANLGISFDCDGKIRAQNRGGFLSLPVSGQWQPLQDWLNSRIDQLFEALSDRYILFGEWCFATHSIYYENLPDWFLGFDLYDRKRSTFLDMKDRNEMLTRLEIYSVPFIASGNFRLAEVTAMLSESKFGSEPAEGLYLRCAESSVEIQRAKIVRPGFIQSIDEHWSHKPLRTNCLSPTIGKPK